MRAKMIARLQAGIGEYSPNQTKLMRETFPAQRTIGEIDISDIKIDVRSRDDIPLMRSWAAPG
jgi:hypothetical protein